MLNATALALAKDWTYSGGHSHSPYYIYGTFVPIAGTLRDRSDLRIEYSAWMYVGVNSVITSAIVVGLVSQLWLRKRHPGWYKKYNYILGGALDGGAQVMIFILSFAVFGASGVGRPFPTVSGITL